MVPSRGNFTVLTLAFIGGLTVLLGQKLNKGGYPVFKTIFYNFIKFGILNFGICDLPFDLAQGGELVEPFVI
jgi:hypothetical protein